MPEIKKITREKVTPIKLGDKTKLKQDKEEKKDQRTILGKFAKMTKPEMNEWLSEHFGELPKKVKVGLAFIVRLLRAIAKQLSKQGRKEDDG